jgi:hypothetical protein
MEPVFRPFIPGIRKKPGTAGLSAKEFRDRKRKRLERERHNDAPVLVTPLTSGEKEIQNATNYTAQLQSEIVVSPVVDSEQQRQSHSENSEKIRQDRLNSRPEEELLLQDLKSRIDSLEKEERNICEGRCRLQTQIQEMEARRVELSKALENERAALQMEETKYLELETDLAGFQQTLNHIQSRREAIQQATEKTRYESIQLQTIVQNIREEILQLEKTQNECAQELETQKKELENERMIFASTMKKTCLNISRLREAIERLTKCNQKEAAARASTLAVAKQTLHTGKHKLSVILSDQKQPNEPDLKTVYWCPNPGKKGKRKKSTRSSRHASTPEENAATSLSIVHNKKGIKTFESEPLVTEQDHATPVQQRRRKSEGDSLSRLGDTRSVNSQKLSSGEKNKKYGGLRKQIFKETWRTDSLAASSEEKSASPPSLTYMGHEIIRKRRRQNQFATI